MIHWTDQIKELLNAKEIMKMRDNCGPLQEIAFRQSHSAKLLNISQQLQKPGVRHIQNILQLSKSLYVQRFSKLTKGIQVLQVSNQESSLDQFLLTHRLECYSLVLLIIATLLQQQY